MSSHITGERRPLRLASSVPIWEVRVSSRSQPKRDHSSLTHCTFGDEGIVSTWIFTDSPRYPTASATNLAFALAMAFFSAVVMWDLSKRNTGKKEEVERLLREKGDGKEPGGWDSMQERKRLGDRHPRFVYTL